MALSAVQLAGAATSAFLASAVLTPLMRKVALRRNVVDAPDGGRKVQSVAVPYLGGVAIAGAAASVLVAGSLLRGNPGSDARLLLGVLGPALILSLVGLVDDLRGLTPLPRFLVQGAAAALTAYLMAQAGTVGAVSGKMWIDAAVTMFWVVGVTNALNLLDNTDGAAAGVATVAGLGFAAVAGANGQYLIAAMSLVLAGATGGFLLWNRHPARIYMGDSGSLFIGFMLSAIAVRIDLAGQTQGIALAVPVLVLAVPILDTSLVVTSRLQRGLSPFTGGLDHLAHRLRRTGLGTWGAVLTMWAVAVGYSLLAFAVSRASAGVAAALISVGAVAFVAMFVFAYRLPATGDLARN